LVHTIRVVVVVMILDEISSDDMEVTPVDLHIVDYLPDFYVMHDEATLSASKEMTYGRVRSLPHPPIMSLRIVELERNIETYVLKEAEFTMVGRY
jgi:hypothetical protein